MPDLRAVTLRPYRKVRIAAIPLLLCVALTSGCRTSDDASAAAKQLTETAGLLTGYYSTLDTLVSETGQLYQVQAAINPLTPYDTETRNYVSDTAGEIQKREELAAALTTLAQNFASLNGSTAATDASTAAGNLESAVAALKISRVTMSSSHVIAMKDAVDLIVKAIQEHKERAAATAIDQFTSALDTWFQSEEPLYNTIGSNYANVTRSLAQALISRGQVDPSSFLSVVLSPYGLTPQLTDPTLRRSVLQILAAHVDQKSAALVTAQETATTNMEKSLSEMASRIHLVATDKPMAIRTAPITLSEVQNWISQVPQFAPASAAATAKSSSATATEKK
ncbi:MAG TPA: hypothetical protein VME86_12940 [Acidobacteriaceae bacterium]|nr:hypothetical protein [Acidobacteriaceae bacterium]